MSEPNALRVRLERKLMNLEAGLATQESWKVDLQGRLEATDRRIATKRAEIQEVRAVLDSL